MAQHTRAPGQSDDAAAAARTTPPAGPAAPSAPDDTVEYSQPGKRGLDRLQITIAAIFAALLVALLVYIWAVNRPQPAQTPLPAPAPVASTTAAATPAVPPSTAAYAGAETTYRAWQTNYAAGYLNYQPDKLDASLVTPDVLSKVQAEIARLGKGANTTVHTSQDIKSVTGADYTSSSLTLRVCAVTIFQFIDPSGKDVTLYSDGSPRPVNTTARTNDVKMVRPDSGKTWQVAGLSTELNAEAGSPC